MATQWRIWTTYCTGVAIYFINSPRQFLVQFGSMILCLSFLYILPFPYPLYILLIVGKGRCYIYDAWVTSRTLYILIRVPRLHSLSYTHVVVITWREASRIFRYNVNKPNMAFNETENYIQPQSKKISLIVDVVCMWVTGNERKQVAYTRSGGIL